MLDLDALEGAATLSAMEGQSRIFFQGVQHQNYSMQSPGNGPFSESSRPMLSEAMHSSALNVTSASLEDDSMLEIDDSSLAEFLRDVMMPASPNSMVGANALEFIPQSYERDVFNFGMESSLDFNDLDIGWMNSQNSRTPMWNHNVLPGQDDRLDCGQETPDVRSGINAGAEAFQKSLWRWKPVQQEHAYSEQVNLSLPYKDMQNLETRLAPDILDQRIEATSRDRILAMLLSTCEPANVSRVVTSFPSADLLDSLMHLFFRTELSRTDSWIHLPTFRPQVQRPELNGMVVAAGAVLSAVPTVRKLGFAIQEAVRLAIPQIVGYISSPNLDPSTELLQYLKSISILCSWRRIFKGSPWRSAHNHQAGNWIIVQQRGKLNCVHH
jgi:hypothetical protein